MTIYGGAATEAAAELEPQPRPAAPDAREEAAIERPRLGFHQSRLHLHACRAQALETLAVDGLERVAHRRDHARDAGGDERVGAGPGAAGVRARFEGDVGGGALRAVTSLLQREHFRVRPALALVRSEGHT